MTIIVLLPTNVLFHANVYRNFLYFNNFIVTKCHVHIGIVQYSKVI